jgi:glycosyltransferase involved in cell wall biosynthesis
MHLKILYVVHQFFPRHLTGTETYTYELARAAQQSGHDASVLCYEHSNLPGVPRKGVLHDEYDGIPVTRFCYDSRTWKNPTLYEYWNEEFRELANTFFQKQRPDIIHFTHNSLLSAALLDAARGLAIPTILTLTDFWYICPRMQLVRQNGALCEGPVGELDCYECFHAPALDRWRFITGRLPGFARKAVAALRSRLKRKVLTARASSDKFLDAALNRAPRLKEAIKLVDIVIVATRFLRDMFQKNGFDTSRWRLINFGINTALLDRAQRTPANSFRFAFVGTLNHHKGCHVLIDVFKEIPGESLELQIYGSETQFPDYARALRKSAAADSRIKFRGTFHREDIGRVLAGMDALVMPSLWYENSPLMLLFALASHTPVIATDVGGLSEFIRDDENGLLFKAGDAGSLRAAMKRFLDDPALAPRIRAASANVKSIAEHSAEIQNIYRSLVKTTAKGGTP